MALALTAGGSTPFAEQAQSAIASKAPPTKANVNAPSPAVVVEAAQAALPVDAAAAEVHISVEELAAMRITEARIHYREDIIDYREDMIDYRELPASETQLIHRCSAHATKVLY